jgi:HAD superfamily hydrolase (TIGR01509 family)
MIKAFLFDYDGVITAGVKDNVPATRLANNLGIPIEKTSEWIISIWDGFSTGKLTEQEAWQKIEEQHGQPISLEQRDIWYTWEELQPLPEMLELVRMLKARGYTIGLLSNVLPVTAQLIRQNGGYDEFDFLVLSCEVGARKPASLVYETALANLEGIEPEEVVYLDDREPLAIAASKLGVRGIYVTDHDEAIKDVQQLIEE